MTDSDFEDTADFDTNDISKILKEIDSANLALDSIDVRADKLKASIMSLLQAQSQPNPFANTEPVPLEKEIDAPNVESLSIASVATADAPSDQTPKENSTLSVKAPASN
ncbi:hypothetical protein BGX27_010960 [Mortierella sp. AM989]|nr:hypothetical protein BGX27_010960 [Mortierella sp. AM989]